MLSSNSPEEKSQAKSVFVESQSKSPVNIPKSPEVLTQSPKLAESPKAPESPIQDNTPNSPGIPAESPKTVDSSKQTKSPESVDISQSPVNFAESKKVEAESLKQATNESVEPKIVSNTKLPIPEMLLGRARRTRIAASLSIDTNGPIKNEVKKSRESRLIAPKVNLQVPKNVYTNFTAKPASIRMSGVFVSGRSKRRTTRMSGIGES